VKFIGSGVDEIRWLTPAFAGLRRGVQPPLQIHQRPILRGLGDEAGVGVGDDVRPTNFPEASKME
jgi:hypothetical protein